MSNIKPLYKFRKSDNIGTPTAETDPYLENCFIDTGDFTSLLDFEDSRSIVIGRTGSGKSALLRRLRNVGEKVRIINPDDLAIEYISDSTIVNFLNELEIKPDIFYRLLWRHVFAVEILRDLYDLNSEKDLKDLYDDLLLRFNRKAFKRKADAIGYLKQYGGNFWKKTDEIVKEITESVESEIKAKAGLDNLSTSAIRKLKGGEKKFVAQRTKEVLETALFRRLSEIITVLDDIIDDPQKKFYIVIDHLDEPWVDDKQRYVLIRSLIEAIRDFSERVQQVKVIVALRIDLLERVFKATRESGFQEEKYEAMYLPITWSVSNLTELLNSRVSSLIEHRYTKKKPEFADIIPHSIQGTRTINYLLSRTLMRPRDVIQLFNYCLESATDSPVIDEDMIKQALGKFSRSRLKAVADEWSGNYPNLIAFTELIKNHKSIFQLKDIPAEECSNFCADIVIDGDGLRFDPLLKSADKYFNGKQTTINAVSFLRNVFKIFYEVGIVDIKLEGEQVFSQSNFGIRSISEAEINNSTYVQVHPCFWRVLGIYK